MHACMHAKMVRVVCMQTMESAACKPMYYFACKQRNLLHANKCIILHANNGVCHMQTTDSVACNNMLLFAVQNLFHNFHTLVDKVHSWPSSQHVCKSTQLSATNILQSKNRLHTTPLNHLRPLKKQLIKDKAWQEGYIAPRQLGTCVDQWDMRGWSIYSASHTPYCTAQKMLSHSDMFVF